MARINTLEKFLEAYGDKPALQTLVDEYEVPTADNFHFWRESCRDFFDERDKPAINRIDSELDKIHNVHVNQNDKSLVCYFPDEEKLKRDTPTSIKLGKYLTRFYTDLSNDQIKDIVSEHKYRYSPPELFIIEDGDSDKAEWVYENGPRSCMKREAGYIKADQKHPCRIYNGQGDLALAYIMKGDRVTTRTVVNTRTKKFVKIHGEAPLITPMLEDLGYTQDSSLGTARIPRMAGNSPARFLMPYIDGEANVYEHDENFFVLNPTTRPQGDRVCTAHSTDGWATARVYGQTWCAYCEDYHADEIITQIDGANYCNPCIEEHFIHAIQPDGTTALANPRLVFNIPFTNIHYNNRDTAHNAGWRPVYLPGNVIAYTYTGPDTSRDTSTINPAMVTVNGNRFDPSDLTHSRLHIIPSNPPSTRYYMANDCPEQSTPLFTLAKTILEQHTFDPSSTYEQVAESLTEIFNTNYSVLTDPLVNVIIAALLASPAPENLTTLTEVA